MNDGTVHRKRRGLANEIGAFKDETTMHLKGVSKYFLSKTHQVFGSITRHLVVRRLLIFNFIEQKKAPIKVSFLLHITYQFLKLSIIALKYSINVLL